MKEILENGPVQATMEVKEDFFMYSGGVYSYSMPADYMFQNQNLGQGFAASTVMLVTVLIILIPWAYLEFGGKKQNG